MKSRVYDLGHYTSAIVIHQSALAFDGIAQHPLISRFFLKEVSAHRRDPSHKQWVSMLVGKIWPRTVIHLIL